MEGQQDFECMDSLVGTPGTPCYEDIESNGLMVRRNTSIQDQFPEATVPVKEQASFCHDVFRIVRTSGPS